MAGSVNKVILIGHLGKDPETRTMPSGDICVTFSVATSESWKDKATGKRRENTEWHRVTIWNQGIAKVAERYLEKGTKVYIEGRLETRKWTDKDGVEKYTTEVVLRPFNGSMVMLDRAKGSGGNAAPADDGNNGYYSQQPLGQQTQPEEMDSEIPF